MIIPPKESRPKHPARLHAADRNLRVLVLASLALTGYTGVVNYLGARLTSEPAALTPIMQTLQQRGLVYIDDGSSPRSAAEEVASGVGLPIRHVDIAIDSDSNFDSISAKLAQARGNGCRRSDRHRHRHRLSLHDRRPGKLGEKTSLPWHPAGSSQRRFSQSRRLTF